MPQIENFGVLIARDENGHNLPHAELYIYEAGTTSPATAFSDSGLTIPHAVPIIADGAGSFPQVFLSSGAYKLDVKRQGGGSVGGFPRDGVYTSAGEQLSGLSDLIASNATDISTLDAKITQEITTLDAKITDDIASANFSQFAAEYQAFEDGKSTDFQNALDNLVVDGTNLSSKADKGGSDTTMAEAMRIVSGHSLKLGSVANFITATDHVMGVSSPQSQSKQTGANLEFLFSAIDNEYGEFTEISFYSSIAGEYEFAIWDTDGSTHTKVQTATFQASVGLNTFSDTGLVLGDGQLYSFWAKSGGLNYTSATGTGFISGAGSSTKTGDIPDTIGATVEMRITVSGAAVELIDNNNEVVKQMSALLSGATTTEAVAMGVLSPQSRSSSSGNNQEFLFSPVNAQHGEFTEISFYSSIAGEYEFAIWNTDGSTHTKVQTATFQASVGLNTFSDTGLVLGDGQLYSFWAKSGGLNYTSATGTGFISGAGSSTKTGDIPDTIGATVEMRITVSGAAVELIDNNNEVVKQMSALLSGATTTEAVAMGVLSPQSRSSSSGNNQEFLFSPVNAQHGEFTEISFYSSIAGEYEFAIWNTDGSTHTKVQTATFQASVGLNTFLDTGLVLGDGQLYSFWAKSGGLSYTSTTGTGFISGAGSSTKTGDIPDTIGATVELRIVVAKKILKLSSDAKLENYVKPIPRINSNVDFIHTITGNTLTIDYTAKDMRDSVLKAENVTITIPYAGTGLFRYDVIVYDLVVSGLVVLSGVDREFDPENFQSDLDGYIMPMLKVRISDATITSVATMSPFTDGLPITKASYISQEINTVRYGARNFLGKMQRGESLRIVGLGDSITCVGKKISTHPDYPNRLGRDNFTSTYSRDTNNSQDDWLATIPTFTAEELGRTPDSEGPIYTRVGWNWGLVEALERKGYTLGENLFYDNFGHGGAKAQQVYTGGAPTAWLNNVIALNPDVVVLNFGMNDTETSSATYRDGLEGAINTLHDARIDVILMETPRAAQRGVDGVNKYAQQVAIKLGIGIVPVSAISDDASIGALGVNVEDITSANGINHPSYWELGAIGKMLARVVD